MNETSMKGGQEMEQLLQNADYASACDVLKAYATGDFGDMFSHMVDDYRHVSFWVLEVKRGKADAMNYYLDKKAAWAKSGDYCTGKIVRITAAPDRVRPHGVFCNGERIEEEPEFMNRNDVGKYGVLLTQEIKGEDITSVAIVTSFGGRMKELLMTDPQYYEYEEVE